MFDNALPFLVVHGWWISKVILIVTAAVVVMTILLCRRAVHSALIRRHVRTLARRLTPLAEGEVLLGGVLRGEPIRSRSHPSTDALVTEVLECGETNWFEVDGARVEVEGTVHVLRGSAIAAQWWGATRVSLPENSMHPHAGSRFEHTVREGDEVLISGHARLRAIDASEGSGRWVVSGEPVQVHALRPARTAPALGPWLVVLALVVTAGTYGVLWALGSQLIEGAADIAGHEHRMAGSVEPADPLVIASALPGSRGRALEELERKLDVYVVNTELGIKQRVELAGLQHGCYGTSYSLLREGEYAEALAAATKCGAKSVKISALLALGRYAEAADASLLEVATREQRFLTLVAAKRWKDAAQVVDEVATALGSGADFESARCIAELMRWFGGERNHAVPENSSGACLLAKALSSDTAKLPALLAVNRQLTRDDPAWSAAWRIGWMYGAKLDVADEATIAVSSSLVDAIEAWLAPAAIENDGSRSAHAWRAVHHVLRGNFEAANAESRLAATLAAPAGPLSWDGAQGLEIGVQLRAGNLKIDAQRTTDGEMHFAVRELVSIRTAREISLRRDSMMVSSDCKANVDQAMTSAMRGDGTPLVELLEQCRLYQTGVALLLAVAPRVQSHRRRLANAASSALDDRLTVEPPFIFVQQLSWRRDLARAFGSTADTAQLQAMIDGHLDAFATREQLVALLLWRRMAG